MVPISSFVALVLTAYLGILVSYAVDNLNLQLEQGCPEKLGSATSDPISGLGNHVTTLRDRLRPPGSKDQSERDTFCTSVIFVSC